MKKYQTAAAALVILFLLGIGAVYYFVWKPGKPYGDPFWSPNRQYYLQKFSNLTVSRFQPAMPGQGSDAIEGYIRLFDKDGNLLDEIFITYLARDIKPVWAEKKIYIIGVSELDDAPWILPSSAE